MHNQVSINELLVIINVMESFCAIVYLYSPNIFLSKYKFKGSIIQHYSYSLNVSDVLITLGGFVQYWMGWTPFSVASKHYQQEMLNFPPASQHKQWSHWSSISLSIRRCLSDNLPTGVILMIVCTLFSIHFFSIPTLWWLLITFCCSFCNPDSKSNIMLAQHLWEESRGLVSFTGLISVGETTFDWGLPRHKLLIILRIWSTQMNN